MLTEYYQLNFTELQQRIRLPSMASLAPLRAAVLRNVMLEPIETYWKFLAKSSGFMIDTKFGQYDQIFAEAVGGSPELLNNETDIVFIFCQLETLSPRLTHRFTVLSKEQIQEECSRVEVFCQAVIAGIRRQTPALILWHGFELPAYPATGIMDVAIGGGQIDTICQLNEHIRSMLQDIEKAYFVDLEMCRTRVGSNVFYDQRYWHIGHAPYSREAYREIAYEDFKYIRALKAKNKKCLVLDCDNTLWGGIIGEDGLAKISLSTTHPGSMYHELQQEILNLYDRGIILALCSKNNEADVWEVFRSHLGMVLREEHIAAAQINWDDKVTNIRRIADQLNIGTDSIVFMDDSEFEIGLVRQSLPEVEVIGLAGKSPVEYRSLLAKCGLFDVLTMTEEDKKRGKMYKQESQRKKMAEQFVDISMYLRSLKMEASIRPADELSVARLSQLTQRTNQFNLTTRRYSEDEIRSFLQNDMMQVLVLELKDQFGDMGMVGICILRFQSDWAEIDAFLLSCRAFGRRAEDIILVKALQSAKDRGVQFVKAQYQATPKNIIVKDFYERHGFSIISQDENNKKYGIPVINIEISMPAEYVQILTK